MLLNFAAFFQNYTRLVITALSMFIYVYIHRSFSKTFFTYFSFIHEKLFTVNDMIL
jgi:hypothetical protein